MKNGKNCGVHLVYFAQPFVRNLAISFINVESRFLYYLCAFFTSPPHPRRLFFFHNAIVSVTKENISAVLIKQINPNGSSLDQFECLYQTEHYYFEIRRCTFGFRHQSILFYICYSISDTLFSRYLVTLSHMIFLLNSSTTWNARLAHFKLYNTRQTSGRWFFSINYWWFFVTDIEK